MLHKCEIRCHKSRIITLTPESPPFWAINCANGARPDHANQLAPTKLFAVHRVEVGDFCVRRLLGPGAEIANVRSRFAAWIAQPSILHSNNPSEAAP